MFSKLLFLSEKIFDKSHELWEHRSSKKLTSTVLVFVFFVSLILSVGVHYGFWSLGAYDAKFDNLLFGIEIVFTLLLITELFALIFVLPQSVALSLVKQFELLSLIFLRDGFKEFSHMGFYVSWESSHESLLFMFVYAIGSTVIFALLGLTRRLQKHIPFAIEEEGKKEFVSLKKFLSLLMLVAFAVVGYHDIVVLIDTGDYAHSFQTFYNVLIFVDIAILLIALRYTMNYLRLFRYSGFILATVMIRLALSLTPYYDVIVGVSAATFFLMLTFFFNYFIKENS